MKNITKSVAVVGQVLGLLVGAKFTTPTAHILETNTNIALF